MGKDLDILPPKRGETLVNVVITKARDTAYATYHQEKPRVTIKGIRAEPGHVRIPPKLSTMVEKKKKEPQPAEVQEEKRKRITVGVVNKKYNDLFKMTQSLENRIDHEEMEHYDLEDKFNVLRRYVSVKLQKIMDDMAKD